MSEDLNDKCSEQSIIEAQNYYEEAIMGLRTILTQIPALMIISRKIVAQLKSGNKILICGNGSSGAQAQQFSTTLSNSTPKSYPIIPLCTDGTLLTSIIEDQGAEEVFAHQVKTLGNKGDILIVLSVSGQSKSILKAIEAAKSKGILTVAFLGRDGGICKDVADWEITVRREATARIMETHHFCLNVLYDFIQKEFGDDV